MFDSEAEVNTSCCVAISRCDHEIHFHSKLWIACRVQLLITNCVSVVRMCVCVCYVAFVLHSQRHDIHIFFHRIYRATPAHAHYFCFFQSANRARMRNEFVRVHHARMCQSFSHCSFCFVMKSKGSNGTAFRFALSFAGAGRMNRRGAPRIEWRDDEHGHRLRQIGLWSARPYPVIGRHSLVLLSVSLPSQSNGSQSNWRQSALRHSYE